MQCQFIIDYLLFLQILYHYNLYRMNSSKKMGLGSTSEGYRRVNEANSLLRLSLIKCGLKYCATGANNIKNQMELTFKNQQNNLSSQLKQYSFNETDQHLTNYYLLREDEKKLAELTEYYKYYHQTSIIFDFHQETFQIMRFHREHKKIVEYNRLKAMLNLSNSTQQDTETDQKHNITPASSFHILSKIKFTNNSQNQESVMLEKLKNNLLCELGPNCHKTIQQIDNTYRFELKDKKKTNCNQDAIGKKMKSSSKQRHSQLPSLLNKIPFQKKRGSCSSLPDWQIKKSELKTRQTTKRKHISMERTNGFTKQINCKKVKCKQSLKISTKKEKTKTGKTQEQQTLHSKSIQINERILEIKERIRRQKEYLKRKSTTTTNQSLMAKQGKKQRNMLDRLTTKASNGQP